MAFSFKGKIDELFLVLGLYLVLMCRTVLCLTTPLYANEIKSIQLHDFIGMIWPLESIRYILCPVV